MEDTIYLYTAIAKNKDAEKFGSNYYVKKEYDKNQVKDILDLANSYVLECSQHSYYEGEYDDYWTDTKEISTENILIKNNQLYGFVFDSVVCWTGNRKTSKVVLLLKDCNKKTVSLYSSSLDHGDTMSESSTDAKLVKRKK